MGQVFLELQSISKSFGEFQAVDKASLTISQGGIFGLLGPNGAGKTTMIRMITSITAPDQGQILFDGKPLQKEHSALIGYMPEERGLYKKMKVLEQLVYLLQLKGLSKKDAATAVAEWMQRFDIEDWGPKNVSELSKGMQQKVQFIATVAHRPKLLIFDEPFSGLDPINTNLIEAEIRRLHEEGTTIIFSTHRMEQVEELCTEIGLINQGKVVLEDSVTNARKKFDKQEYDLQYVGEESEIQNIAGAEIVDSNPGNARLKLQEGTNANKFLRSITELNIEILKFEHHLPRLNEIFIEIVTGENGSHE